jgi:hypothetical protein
MTPIKEYFQNILNQYEIWKTNQMFYHNKTCSPDLHYFLQLPSYHYQDVESINSCDQSVIVINNLTESIHSDKYFRRYNQNKHYIILTGGTWDKDKHNIGIKNYDIMYYCFFLVEMLDTYMSPHRFCFYLDKNYDFKYPKDYVFCSTIGNVRHERDKVIDAISRNIEYKNYILRYSGENLGIPNDHLDVVNFVKGEFDPYTALIPEYYHNVSQTLPIDMYNSAYLNLVVETDIDWQDSFFITEKTVKSLITGMPFIIVSTPLFLKNLQDLGFRTYNTLWDESYDEETDSVKRINKITQVLQKLNTFDWQEHKNQLKEIADHNLRNMLNSDKILNEFFENFEKIVEKINECRC